MLAATADTDDLRRQAAAAALAEVTPGMKLGLGTGRTAEHFVRALAVRVRDGLAVIGVPTSKATAKLAAAEGIPLTTLDDEPILDLVVDGADEIDHELRLIKGGGGALLREKIVAAAARRMIVIADAAKLVDTLGAFPLPVEIIPFGAAATRLAIERVLARLDLPTTMTVRRRDGGPFVTDNGNWIVDLSLGRIPDPERLARELDGLTGVVEHGLFVGLAGAALVAGADGVRRLPPQ